MTDPLIARLIAVGLSLLWLSAAWHKLAAPQVFRAILHDYRVLPGNVLNAATVLVPVLEAALGLALLLGAAAPVTAVASATLLGFYAIAMSVNLLRGRVHIGCGCGFSASTESQPLSWMLVFRNVLLVLASLATVLPTDPRVLGTVDYAVLGIALLVLVLLKIAASQLLRNGAAIRLWRNSYD